MIAIDTNILVRYLVKVGCISEASYTEPKMVHDAIAYAPYVSLTAKASTPETLAKASLPLS